MLCALAYAGPWVALQGKHCTWNDARRWLHRRALGDVATRIGAIYNVGGMRGALARESALLCAMLYAAH